MPKHTDRLGPAERMNFLLLAGRDPQTIGVGTHADALNYLHLVDASRRKGRARKKASAAEQPGLLGLAMRGQHG